MRISIKPQHRIWLAGTAVAALLGAWWWSARPGPPPQPSPDGAPQIQADPRLSTSSPYRNVRSEVRYVGSEACARCHAEQAGTYHAHPMGRSLMTVAEAPAAERLDPAAGNPFDAGQHRYSVERRDGKMFHREVRLDNQGRAIYTAEEEIALVVGAGDHGRSYLVDRDGSLFQSPIAWYPQRQAWALSPGYDSINQHFTRPIQSECLFCHANFANHIAGTIGRYQEPMFRGQTIGCERCHGPAELHIAKHSAPPVPQPSTLDPQPSTVPQPLDDTIVNPRDLPPNLREAVCQQCHLSGAIRVTRFGRDWYDFRPGLPLEDFVSTFAYTSKEDRKSPITGHVEQMYDSRCFQASGGKLGCITCHDPHVKPTETERVELFRGRCTTCHTAQSCTAAEATRLATAPADNCMACHMPAIPTEIRHAAITDHRVPRIPGQANTTQPSDGLSLAGFHRTSAIADAQLTRDLGIAIVRLLDQAPARLTARDRDAAAGFLKAAVDRNADDVDAAEALAHFRWEQGNADAVALIDRVLTLAPRREFALHTAAMQAESLRRFDLAAGFWRRVLDVNPAMHEYHQGLALALGQQRQWPQAIASCRRALELFPGDSQTRQLLIECLLGQGDTVQAQTEFDLLLRLDPEQTAELRRWFENHPFRVRN